MRILKNAWDLICKNKPSIFPESINLTESDMNIIRTARMYPHIPDKIRKEFESTSQRGIKCESELLRGRKAVIYISAHSCSRNEMKSYLIDILAWLNFVSGIASPDCSKILNVYLLLTDERKRLPMVDTEPIDEIHANTAFTTSCSEMNDIFVYRREEWFKVLMHETFHCFGLDFSSSNGDKSNEHILSIFPAVDPNTDVRLYETFCEMWAEVFHLMFCLFPKFNRFSEKRYRQALLREQRFSICQSNKILRRAGYRYNEILTFPSSPLYKENTPALSYYVIKSILLWNLDRFVKWCSKYGTGKVPIQFKMNHIDQYCDLVEEMTQNDGGYGKTAEAMNNHKNAANSSRTLRMTSVDSHP